MIIIFFYIHLFMHRFQQGTVDGHRSHGSHFDFHNQNSPCAAQQPAIAPTETAAQSIIRTQNRKLHTGVSLYCSYRNPSIRSSIHCIFVRPFGLFGRSSILSNLPTSGNCRSLPLHVDDLYTHTVAFHSTVHCTTAAFTSKLHRPPAFLRA